MLAMPKYHRGLWLGVLTYVNWGSPLLAQSAATQTEVPLTVSPQMSPQGASEPALPAPSFGLGLRFDCMHEFNRNKGAAQTCLGLSGLRFTMNEQVAPNLHARLRLDPFATPRSSREDSPLRTALPGSADTALGIVDAFAVTWTARPSLDLSLQTYDGAALMPSVSALSLANSFMDAGWKQVALTLGYELTIPIPMAVVLVAGNGEGQTVRSQTPQEYFGIQAKATVSKALHLILGVSVNGNDAGTEDYTYVTKQYAATCGIPVPAVGATQGHATRRTGIGLRFDAGSVGATGLQVGLAWQSNFTKDLGKDPQGYPLLTQLQQNNCQLDPDVLFPEQAGILGSARRTTYDLSMHYLLRGSFYLGADYTMRRLSTGGSQAFHFCDAFVNNQCSSVSPSASSQLQQTAWTVGVGAALAPGLEWSIEYFDAAYDKSYAQLFYAGPDGKASKDLAVFNARLAYRWQ